MQIHKKLCPYVVKNFLVRISEIRGKKQKERN